MEHAMSDTPQAQPLTLVLADDHAIVREGIAALCATHGFHIVGQCSDGPAAVDLILAEKPDFAILDIHMPSLTGIEAVRKLRAAGSSTKLIILSISRDESLVMDALAAGADAYLLKDGPGRHLVDAVNFVRDGGVYVSPLLRGAGIFTHPERRAQPDNPLSALSPREIEVFSYLVNGLRPKDIAELLDISPKTVDTYRAGLMRKLNVHDLVGLVKFAIEHNLTTTTPAQH
jgi:DNA-binding NarL/FixJ family response regulator